MPTPTQTDPAEGPREDGPPDAAQGDAQGVSSTDPAEGEDDLPAPGPGSPRG